MPRIFKNKKEQQPLQEKKEIDIKEEEVLDPSKPRVINRLVGTLGSALEEEAEEIDELLSSQVIKGDNPDNYESASTYENSLGFFTKRIYTVIGVIVLVLSIIGAITCVNFAGNLIYDIADRRSLKNEFATFVYPVVITDPPEFKSTENLQPLTVISSSVWKIILNGNTEKYEKNMGMMTIPAIDVEASARSIFGYGYEIEHRTIDDIDITFEYNAEKNSYIVPEKPRYMTYMPRISEISNVGELYKVTVEYIAPSTLSVAGIEYDEEPIKTLIYTISRSKEKMTINSVEYSENPESLHF